MDGCCRVIWIGDASFDTGLMMIGERRIEAMHLIECMIFAACNTLGFFLLM